MQMLSHPGASLDDCPPCLLPLVFLYCNQWPTFCDYRPVWAFADVVDIYFYPTLINCWSFLLDSRSWLKCGCPKVLHEWSTSLMPDLPMCFLHSVLVTICEHTDPLLGWAPWGQINYLQAILILMWSAKFETSFAEVTGSWVLDNIFGTAKDFWQYLVSNGMLLRAASVGMCIT